MTDYQVTLDLEFEEPVTVDYILDELRLLDVLAQWAPALAVDGTRLTVAGSVTRSSIEQATRRLQRAVQEAVPGTYTVIGVAAREQGAVERDFEAPNFPRIVGAAEVGEILGVSRQRVHQLRATHRTFPEPIVELRMGPLWVEGGIREWADSWERKPGRPRAPRSPVATCHD